ncbi:MAG: helix-turn-helix domain-containing protein, partial [Thaumarchaeota archaeon]|nr:helix-turn-helix domain-containing protein [Nitrososphaerota archaeon]
MADFADGERQEAIPKGKEFMPRVSTKQLYNAFKAERVGKSKFMLEACLLRRGSMGIRAIAERIRVSYSTVRGWLERMKDGDLKRRFDKKRPGQKRQLDEHMVHAIRRWLGDP